MGGRGRAGPGRQDKGVPWVWIGSMKVRRARVQVIPARVTPVPIRVVAPASHSDPSQSESSARTSPALRRREFPAPMACRASCRIRSCDSDRAWALADSDRGVYACARAWARAWAREGVCVWRGGGGYVCVRARRVSRTWAPPWAATGSSRLSRCASPYPSHRRRSYPSHLTQSPPAIACPAP